MKIEKIEIINNRIAVIYYKFLFFFVIKRDVINDYWELI
jgi:hypothetical protein